MRIAVLDDATLHLGKAQWEPVRELGELILCGRAPHEPEAVVRLAADAEIILTNKVPLTAGTLGQLPRLRLISVLATGCNIVDAAAARERGIAVCNVPAYSTDSVAQHTVALILELCHHAGLHDRSVKAGEWSACSDFSYWKKPLIELAGLTAGIIGFGRIGRRVGEILHAFGANILAHDPARGAPPQYQPFAWAEAEEIFSNADIVTLHCPQTAENARFVNEALLRKMKSGAFLINTSRGGLVDEQALADALNQDVIAGAAADVVETEPPRPDCPLPRAKNCVITPHMAWSGLNARRRLLQTTVENIRAFLAGQPVNIVN